MKSGGYLIFEQTEAMYVVDVNSGPYAAKARQEDNSLKNKRFIYKSDENMIYLLEQDSEYVTIIKGKKLNILNSELDNSSIVINKSDSIKVIGIDTCKLVALS